MVYSQIKISDPYFYVLVVFFVVVGWTCGTTFLLYFLSSGTRVAADPTPSSSSSLNSGAAAAMSGGIYRAVLVTVPTIEVGKKIAEGVVKNKLAACVNIIPQVTSIYEWKGKLEEDSELLLIIKTQVDNFDELSAFVHANHPAEVPEVISLPIDQGSKAYLDWVKAGSTKDSNN